MYIIWYTDVHCTKPFQVVCAASMAIARLLSEASSAMELDPESPVYVLPKEPHGLRSFLEQPVARISHVEWPAAMETWWKWPHWSIGCSVRGDHQ